MNKLFLQTLDGLPLAESIEHVRCSGCNIRLREGTKVIAHAYLDDHWKPDGGYCPSCHIDEETSSSSEKEQAITEGRIIVRHDQTRQTARPALHTRGYSLLQHSQPQTSREHRKIGNFDSTEVTTGGGGGQ